MSTKDSPRKSVSGKPPLALIAGPTASGKSDLAVELALRIEAAGRRAAIINADSAQVYGDLRVLSARPSVAEMRGIDHILFGAWDGAEACSAADWASAARDHIGEIQNRGEVPILVGGTGLYLRTLLDGIAPVPVIDPAVREEVRAMPVDRAFAALQAEDPNRAAMLAPADAARIARALEVVRATGKSLEYWQTQRTGGIGNAVDLRAAVLLPDRQSLYERCDLRFAQMIERGAVQEVEVLLARHLNPALPVMRAIGVREIAAMIRGELSPADAATAACQATRNYAKRQYTWFRNQPPSDWTRITYDHFNMSAIADTLYQDMGLT